MTSAVRRAKKLLVIQAAGLGWDFLRARQGERCAGLRFQPAQSVFPAVTCTVQASFRTALPPAEHGMPANGYFDRRLCRVFFWEQSAQLVQGARIWDAWRASGGTTGLLFWQQSLGEEADVVLSPAPIHKHHGGMIQACYSRPPELYRQLAAATGYDFDLRSYWGPLAAARSSAWISAAACALLASPAAPGCCLVYLPLLDYDLQRFGPRHARCGKALAQLLQRVQELLAAARHQGYELLLFGDYAVAECPHGPAYPQHALHQAGLFATRTIRGRLYPDTFASKAIAVTDHEVAHVYIRDPAAIEATKSVLEQTDGVERVERPRAAAQARQGDLLAVAAEGRWFSYKWWDDPRQAPDYATHVDIHNKPGFDPGELFFGWPPGRISGNDLRIGGSHGRTGAGREVAWATTCPALQGDSILELSRSVKHWLSGES